MGPRGSENTHSTKVNTIIGKIDRKAEELLRAKSITARDLEIVKARLSFAWKEPRTQGITEVTSWRDVAVRTTYSQVQNFNDHLLLPFVLAATPTDCSTPAIREVLRILFEGHEYTSYRLSLGHGSKELLQSWAKASGFVTKSRYLTLIGSLFPQEEPHEQEQARLIEFMYSQVPIKDVPAFLQSLIPGVSRSQKFAGETKGEAVVSNCATILIPLDKKDCICHFILDRDIAMESISKYGLSSITA